MCFVILPVRGRAPAWAIATDTFGAGAAGHLPGWTGFFLDSWRFSLIPKEPTAENLNRALREGETEFEQNSCPGAGNAKLPKDY